MGSYFNRPMVNLAQLVGRGCADCVHEMRGVLLVGAARAGAFLAREPDLFLRDRRKGVEAGELARVEATVSSIAASCCKEVGFVSLMAVSSAFGHASPMTHSSGKYRWR